MENKNSSLKSWIQASRPRTLPLALSSIFLGSFIAGSQGLFSMKVSFLCVLTTIFLQILSNLANDYGDSISGVDGKNRKGPSRAVQTGEISSEAMKKAIILFSLLSAISGLALIYGEDLRIFIPLGLASIVCAITYTVGKKPYGYIGLGDLSVFTFFGLVGVIGSNYLQTHNFDWKIILPAMALGFFSTAVLNINNIRDIESDELSGKKSLPVRLGIEKAKKYHYFLLFGGILTPFLYVIFNYKSPFQFLFLFSIPLIIKNGLGIKNGNKPEEIDPFLKQMAISTLIFVLTFGIGNLI
ncbi:MAG: 1,4-dihydroxy-2-naphthoate polyprenyltransferase [Candidatus Sericytochromatia bacterium]